MFEIFINTNISLAALAPLLANIDPNTSLHYYNDPEDTNTPIALTLDDTNI